MGPVRSAVAVFALGLAELVPRVFAESCRILLNPDSSTPGGCAIALLRGSDFDIGWTFFQLSMNSTLVQPTDISVNEIDRVTADFVPPTRRVC